MRAVVLKSGEPVLDADAPLPSPATGEVLVRVLRAGICETDLQLIRGYMAFEGILGHEFVGIAEDGPLAGERVVGEINCHCRRCEFCRNGQGNHCPHRSVLGILGHDGAFADYVAVPAANLHWIPNNITTDEAVFVEPLAAAFQIPARVALDYGMRTVVLGDGRLGNLCAQVLKAAGCKVRVIGKHPEKLALLDRLGIETTLRGDAPEQRSADLVVECTGSPSGLEEALAIVKPQGTIVLKTTVADKQSLSLAPVVIDEIRLIGSRCGPFPEAIDALKDKRVEVASLISNRFPLERAQEALEYARNRPVLKVLLDVDAGDP